MAGVPEPRNGEGPDRSTSERRRRLGSLFDPRNIAVIGATETEGSVGRAVWENLLPLGDRAIPVHPQRAMVLGRAAYPRIGAVPVPVDLAVIVTPACTVVDIVRECVEAHVSAAVIISAGFKESGEAGARLERAILVEAARGPMRVVGPNCLGVMVPGVGLNATFAASMARPGHVAFISQSGALCTALLDWSLQEGVGFSAFVSVGSLLDVGWGDLIEHFGDDPQTHSIVCYMESVGDAGSFLTSAGRVTPRKPIIVLKVGRTEAAARAATSHTGAMTGSDAVLDAAFERAGVLRVDTIDELFDMAEVLAKQPRPCGPRLAILTNAGGPGALATDMLVRSGGQIADLSRETLDGLNAMLPPHWSRGNPVDLLGDADAPRYRRAAECLLRDPGVDGLLVILTPQKMTDCVGTAETLVQCPRPEGKPVLASWMGEQAIREGEQVLNRHGIPTYRSPDTAARMFALMWQYSDRVHALSAPGNEPEAPRRVPISGGTERQGAYPGMLSQDRGARVERLFAEVRSRGRTLLTEPEAKEVLMAYGIPSVATRVARTEAEAVGLARRFGFPVVVKLLSETLTHKGDVGGVCLDLKNSEAVRRAFRAIRERVDALPVGDPGSVRGERFAGVTVQPMVETGNAYELILGSSVDAQFGPVVLFGAGGAWVEILRDRALGLPPLSRTWARRLMRHTRMFEVLQGGHGRPPADLLALEATLVRFSQLVEEQPQILEVDLNPLLASSPGVLALDARMVLRPEAQTAAREGLHRPFGI